VFFKDVLKSELHMKVYYVVNEMNRAGQTKGVIIKLLGLCPVFGLFINISLQ
jgi:hypothetical protein